MTLLHLEALPPRTTKGTIVRLLTQVGELDKQRVGVIEIRGREASVEVPDSWAARLVRALDGTPLADRHIRAWHESIASNRDEQDHFTRLVGLLEIEAEAEAEQLVRAQEKLSPAQAEKAGTTLIGLALHDQQAGLGGRVLVTFGKSSKDPLPWTRLGIGAPVLLSQSNDDDRWRGVVSRRSSRTIEVAINQPLQAPDGATYRLDLANDEVARQRQRTALERARAAQGDRLAKLRRVLLGEVKPSFIDTAAVEWDTSLNESQQEAAALALHAEDVAMIHGPPGTGKTTTVVEVIRQAIDRDEKVLACAPSNMAVDNLFEKLLASGIEVVRIGHPARVLPELRAHTLDLVVEEHDDMKLARKLTREAYQLFDKASRYTRAKPLPGARQEQREEAKQLLADARRLEKQVVKQILDNADVLCATLTGLDSELLGQRSFDLLVIDEACQTTEPACWIPMSRCERVVLAGDHCQLPPTVVSREAVKQGFTISMFERLMEAHGNEASCMLSVQYRMNTAIMDFSSQQFYDGSLVAHESVADHLLSELPEIANDELTSRAVEYIDTAGAGFDEELEPDGESRLNLGEAKLLTRKVNALLDAGLPPPSIAIIAPYAAQVRLLKEMLKVDRLEIDTVDGFQGREKEAVLISLVRSNGAGEIGFLKDTRRMNVALTRARRKLLVVGDSATIGNHLFYQQLLDYFEGIGAYRTVWEEPDLT